jgi:membrane-associated phospholipid phosphatase
MSKSNEFFQIFKFEHSMKTFMLFIFLLCYLPSILGQNKKQHDCFLCTDKDHKYKDPYDITFKNDWPYLLTGTTLATAGFFVFKNDNVIPYTQAELDQLNRNDVNSFDRGATYNKSNSAREASDIILVSSLIVMPQFFLYQNHTRNDVGSLLVLSYEVLSINYGLTNIVKSAVNRTRPYAYNPDYTYEQRTDRESRFSFYSGHTSITASISFLWAKVMTDYHPDMAVGYKIGIWSFAALLPATTGYLRVKAGKHYPTDVITGYAIGALTGWLIPQLHKNKKRNISVYPTRVLNTNGIGMTLTF